MIADNAMNKSQHNVEKIVFPTNIASLLNQNFSAFIITPSNNLKSSPVGQSLHKANIRPALLVLQLQIKEEWDYGIQQQVIHCLHFPDVKIRAEENFYCSL